MSSTTGAEPTGHAIAVFSTRLHEVLDGLAGTPAWSMTAGELRVALVELTRAQARLGELRLRVLVAADRAEVGAESGASSTAAWLAHETTAVGSVARAEVRLAAHLDTGFTATRAGLAAGTLSVGQAAVIVASVTALPDSVGAQVRDLAEQHLIGLAATHEEKTLKVLGRRVFEVVDPAADAEDGARLEKQEAAAARGCYLHLFDNGDGTHTGRFKIPSLHAVALAKMLHALLAPRHQAATRAAQAAQAVDPDQTADTDEPTEPAETTEPTETAETPDPAEPAGSGHAADGDPGADGYPGADGDPGPDGDADTDAGTGTHGAADEDPDPACGPVTGSATGPGPRGAADGAAGGPAGAGGAAAGGGPAGGGSVRRSRPEQLGQAFCELLERYPHRRLPQAGGLAASVVVMLDYDRLLTGLGTAQLDTGERISASLARRLACEAGIIPVVYQHVLGGRPRVLDMGRTRRFHTTHQRIALGIEQGGCTAANCDRPAGWCHAHHDDTSWAAGGGTSVEHGRLLCPFHHSTAHNPRYHTEHHPNGTISFHRRT